jgi:hypothetical protein
MNEPATISAKTAPRSRHWPLFLAGLALFALGPAITVAQFSAKMIGTPWPLPIFATAGVALMAASLWQRRGVVRLIAVIPLALIAGGAWYLCLFALRLPEYTGPAVPGRKVPAFSAKLASGQTFTDNDLAQGSSSVLVFYRGHW